MANAHDNSQLKTQLKVFLVEDSSLIRDRVSALLARCDGIELVGTAESVDSAIAGIGAVHPDALIVDLKIVGGTGLDVIEAVRAKRPEVRIAVMTNWPTEQYRRAAFDLGAEYLLDKSTEFARLPEILATWASDGRSAPSQHI